MTARVNTKRLRAHILGCGGEIKPWWQLRDTPRSAVLWRIPGRAGIIGRDITGGGGGCGCAHSALATRRGPATEAQTLYDDLLPDLPDDRAPPAPRYDGGGRPSKRDRRKLNLRRSDTLE